IVRLKYPLFILDPHGDYIGLWKCREMLQEEAPGAEIRLFFPELLMRKSGEALVERLISQMTNGLTEPQSEYIRRLFGKKAAKEGENALEYIRRLIVQNDIDARNNTGGGAKPPTMYAVLRALRIVEGKLSAMRNSSELMRR